MAADEIVGVDPAKSCCAVLKERFLKLEEKRNALRQAVKLLEHQIDKLQTENLSLKKACEEVQAQAEIEREERVKESSARVDLENEISNLKSEISLLQKTRGSRNQEDGGEVTQLQTRVSEGEAEVNRLKELLEKERKKGDSERKKAEAEKKKAAEAWKIVKADKSKVEEQKKLADIERINAEECRLQLEKSKTEANETRAKLVSEVAKTGEAIRKLEVEKQKVSREKKRADSVMAKVEEYRKCSEVERKRASDEKSHADHLSQMLEEEKQRNEALQREIQEIKSARKVEKPRPVPFDHKKNTETANMKLLKKQLKLGKMQLKHAKKVAKLEQVRNNLLQQEIHCLKKEFFQLSNRLNIVDGLVDGFSCHSVEGIDGSAKMCNLLNLQNLNSKRKLPGAEPFDLYCQTENDFIKARCTTRDVFDRLGSTLECNGSWPPICGGGYTKLISGINSELESLVGGSVRNKSETSAINSTTACFSDRKLMNSQGRGAFSVTTSAELPEENLKQGLTIPRLSGEITKVKENNLGVVAESNDISSIHHNPESPCVTSNGHDRVSSSRKKKRIHDAIKSIEYLHSKGKKLHLQMEKKLSALHDMLILEKNMPTAIWSQSEGRSIALGDGRCQVSKAPDVLNAKNYRFSKKRKVSQKQKLDLQLCVKHDKKKQKDELGTEGSEDANVCTQTTSPANHVIETVRSCEDRAVDAVLSNQENEACFENMAVMDYMKLLELDNAVDEERYRLAMEMPLSPTLPEIEPPSLGTSGMDGAKFLAEENVLGWANEKDNLVLHCSFDVIDVEIDSNLHKVKNPVNSFEEPYNNENASHNVIDTAMAGSDQIGESGVEMELEKQIPTLSEGTEVPFASHGGYKAEGICKYCVVFLHTKDETSISRIFFATETCISRSSMVSQRDWVVQKILLALVMEHDLLPEEKACVLFSSLLHNFFVVTSVNFRNFSTRDSSLCSDSFAAHIKAVMADEETRCMFSELCQLDTLLGLIEDFLIGRRVLVCNNVPCDSGSNILLPNGTTIYLSSKTASIDQLVSGSIILASICAAVDYIGFICEASYNILRMYKWDSSLILRVLHVFAYLCGKKYFTMSGYRHVMTVIKSVVSHLERGNKSYDSIPVSYVLSVGNTWPGFSPCSHCPFAKDAVSMDEVISLLLEELQYHTAFGIKHQNLMESPNSSKFRALQHLETSIGSPKNDEDLSIPDMGCNVSCCLDTSRSLATVQTNSVVDRTLCHFGDIFSLVELVACHMNWDWTCGRIIPQLLKMLESCASEKFSAAITVLLGQLGRLGIDAHGNELIGVEDLRFSLSAFLDQNTTIKRGLPSQFAVVNALIGLLSLDFGELVQSGQELPVGTSRSGYTDTIKKWYSRLSKEQKSLSFSVFQSAGVLNN